MGKIIAFARTDAFDVAIQNATKRAEIVLRDTAARFAEETEIPPKALFLFPWALYFRVEEGLKVSDQGCLIACLDTDGRIGTSGNDSARKLGAMLRELPPGPLEELVKGFAGDDQIAAGKPLDAPESGE